MEAEEPLVAALLPQAFAWAREVNPSQPLTSGVWDIDTSKDEARSTRSSEFNCASRTLLRFTTTVGRSSLKREVAWLQRFHRPVICTEYMARPAGSTFDAILPIAKQ